jgi:hypothetical protein
MYLPLALGRWCAVATGMSPAPVLLPEGDFDYLYPFPGRKEREAALALLWPSITARRHDSRTRWLLSLARGETGPPGMGAHSRKTVPLPDVVRQGLIEASGDPRAYLRSAPAWLLPRLRALARRPARQRLHGAGDVGHE